MDDATRGYLDDMRRELRADVQELRGELRAEMRLTAAETRRHFDVTGGALRHQIGVVAEGVELRDELDQQFGLVNLAFADVRRDIAELRARP